MVIFKIFWCIPIFFYYSICVAQQNRTDSLKKIIATAKDDTNKVNTLIDLSQNYLNTDTKTALIYAMQAKDLAEKLNFQNGKGWALKKIGQVYNIQSDYVNALQAWKEALKIFEVSGNKLGTSNMLNNIGVIYYNKSMEDSAQDYYLKSLKVAEEIKDTFRIATALTNVGGVYSNKPATYEKAMQFHRNALLLSIAIGDSELIGNSNGNIGELFVSMQKRNTSSNRYLDSALVYLKRACNFYSHSINQSYALVVIGKVYMIKKDFANAVDYFNRGYEMAKVFDSKLDMAQALLGIAETDTCKGDFKSAIDVYTEAEAMFKDIGLEESYDLEKVYQGLATSYFSLGDFKNAYKYQSLLIDVKKAIYNLEVDKKLGTKLFAYDIEKKQGEINLQQEVISRQKLIRNGFIGGFAVVLLFAVIFLSQRNKIKKGKKRSDELLLNILPEKVAEELKVKGSAEAKLIDEVSVLFTDFKGFTAYSEKMTPKELVKDIHECFSAFDHIMEKYGMEKIKTIGDSYMAAGGLPTPNKTHAEDAVRAALEISRFIAEGKARKIEIGAPYFEIRIGIHTGPVVAGIVGVKKFAYDIWGDTVNTASRMESSGDVGQVNISGATYELVKDKFACTYRGKVQAKGKGEIDMYFVEGILL